ncbi:methyl-accepting chemotaxis protein [Halorussus sp. MSC15.2]|uniref:methyl-accepting chemotaxis protein n=1 Tax=Halorussus sp. MSC15.2 TaxID=2283638 RepID=UPI0013D3D8D3|nr:methyl-accepting chemotaxis protein [Halorussus sp. MSC15.2]NEU56027.1 HAMP domain-containing protein [Halorussus sp. MSC15.2]
MGHTWPFLGKIRRSYALKLAIALVSIVAVTVAVGALVQAQTADEVRADVQEELTTLSNSRADNLDTWLSSVKVQTKLTSRDAALRSGDTDRIRGHLKGMVADGNVPDGVVAVHYYDAAEGTIVTSSNDAMAGVSPAEQGAPFAADPPTFDGRNDVYVSKPFRVPVVDFPVVAVMSPVPNQSDKRVIYMINIENRTKSLTGGVEGGYTVVLNSTGHYLAHPNESKLLSSHHGGADNPAVRAGRAGKSGFTRMDGGMLMGYSPMESSDWVVVVHAPASEAYALSDSVTSNIIGLILLAVVSLALVGVTIGSNTVIALRQLSSKADAMAGGDLQVDLETKRRDEFGSLYDSFARMRDSLHEQIREAETARDEAEEARESAEEARREAESRREEAEALSGHLETKANHYENVMDAAADGDLSVRVDTESRSDAMVAIGSSLNDMLDDIERTVANVKRFASHVSNAVVDVESSAEEVMATGEEVSDSVGEISEGAAHQTEQLGDVASEMNTLSASAQQVAATVDDVAATSEQAAAAGELGKGAAEEALSEMDAVEAATERTAAEIEELDAEMEAIGDIVEVITEIAEQTNMLALNASIEAARTDAEGDGFAVVADEVKNLAEETKESAAEIEGRIERVQEKTAQSVEGMTETSERISAGVETVEGAIDALEEIAEYVEETDSRIQEIQSATENQAESSSAVVQMVDEVASISEETTSQAESVSEAAEAQTETLADVRDDADDLAERAAELSQLLDDFRVTRGAGPMDDTDFQTAEVND